MWDATKNCYLTGTNDPNTRNTTAGQLPLDVQAWSTLALPDGLTVHPQVLAGAEAHHRTSSDNFSGFDFNEDRDGVWFEGTGQMATAYAVAHQTAAADALRAELRRAQSAPFGDGRGIVESSHDGVSTGFGFQLFRRSHVAATGWNVFAQLGFNPFIEPGSPVDVITGSGTGSPNVVAYDARTGVVRFGFSPYPGFAGGVRVAVGDVTGDGIPDIITAAGPGGGPHVRVFDGLTGAPVSGKVGSFFPFAANFTGGVFVAAGDVNADGFADVITGVDSGAGPSVSVVSGKPSDNGLVLASFSAYSSTFMGGVRVASGNVAGHADGHADIITGAGPGGGPHVRVFDIQGGVAQQLAGPIGGFFAYSTTFHGGVYVAAGDVTGDGKVDIITGADAGGGPHVKVFDGVTRAEVRSFFAYGASFSGGVRVGAVDINGDGVLDIITGAGPGGGPHVRVIDGKSGAQLIGFFAYDPTFLGGVFVA
jgi:hypothetical protein